MTLTSVQVADFETRGFLILPAVFNADEVATMAREANRLLELAINSSLNVVASTWILLRRSWTPSTSAQGSVRLAGLLERDGGSPHRTVFGAPERI